MKVLKFAAMILAAATVVCGWIRFGWETASMAFIGIAAFAIYKSIDNALDVGAIIEWYEEHREELHDEQD